MTGHVVLVVPGEEHPSPLRLEDKFPFPLENLGAGYLAAALENHGFEVDIVDGYAARWAGERTAKEAIARLRAHSVLGLSVLQATARVAALVARRVREHGFDGPVVLGGWAATMSPRELLEFIPQATCLVRGEAEELLPDVVRALVEGAPLPERGLAIRDGTGVRSLGEPVRAPFEQLLPRHYAFEQDVAPPRSGAFPIQGSRGCAWGLCSFCSTAGRYGAKAWRMRGVDSLLRELEHPAVLTGQPVFFVDDEFFGPCDEGFARADEFARRVLERGLRLDFGLDSLVQSFEPARFERLRAAGLRRVFLGLESGSPASLKTYRKGFSVKQARAALEGLRSLGIDVISGYILFQPYMSLDDVRAGVEFLATDLAHDGNPGKFLSALHPEAGTALFSQLQADGLLTGQFPSWGFRFQDPRVAHLFALLEEEAGPLRAEYVRRRTAGVTGARDLTDDFLKAFERHWRKAGNT